MLFEDTYRTIAASSEGHFSDRGSKFYGYAIPIYSEEEFKEELHKIKKLHPKATHHTFAYRLGPDKTAFRVNDDGEPSGTAGRPILGQIQSNDLTNILIIVVRYFGGTMLGVPGLINAYKLAAADAIAHAQMINQTVCDVYKLLFDYEKMNDVMKLIKEYNLAITHQLLDNTCELQVSIRKSKVNELIGKLEKIEKVRNEYIKTI